MPLEKVKINNVKIEDTSGDYGPQKKIRFTQILEGGNRNISGWIKAEAFKADQWVENSVLELEVYQKGDYWNFKLPSAAGKAAAQNNAEVVAVLKEILAAIKSLKTAPGKGEDDIPF